MSQDKDTIRNWGQTHQERPVIKMAPDAVIYIDGLPYLFNDYVGEGGTLVNFNDFVTQASGAVDVNSWMPSATVNLSIPNDLRYLVQAPAGQRIIKTMSEIKIFVKGYYLTADGDSAYHRVFWGAVSNVSYADNKKTLEISLTCKGILYLFELMQINENASAMTNMNTGAEVTAWASRFNNQNPFETILAIFQNPLEQNVVDAATVANANTYVPTDVFERSYVVKWNKHLLKMQEAVRMAGLRSKSGLVTDAVQNTTPDPASGNPGTTTAERSGAKVTTVDEVARVIADLDLIQRHAPSAFLGTIGLLESNVTSRLSRMDELVKLMGWEGYQDLDGSIIIKPPLYNLDTQDTKADPTRNPFIIHLPEVLGTEMETEDETQIVATRRTVKGTLAGPPLQDAGQDIIPEATYFDPGLVRQFGLRTEPPKSIPMLENNTYALFAYAVAEMTKMNKNYRTYTVTIPMRPELRLGFPIYVPHLDIYAYLENISWSYARGGQATTTLSCTNVRHRELVSRKKSTKDPKTGAVTEEWLYTAVPDLTFAYSAAPAAPEPPKPGEPPKTNPEGSAGTLPLPKELDPTPEQKALLERQKRTNTIQQVEPDAPGLSWRITKDAEGFFSKARMVDYDYYEKVRKGVQPYTDAKGYIVIRPFPWGRHTSLETALDAFTRPLRRRTGKLLPFEPKSSQEGGQEKENTETWVDGKTVVSVESGEAGTTEAFLMSALGTPSMTATDPTKRTQEDEQVMKKLQALQEKMDDDTTCFVLSYEPAQDPKSLLGSPNPANDGSANLPAAGNTSTAVDSKEKAEAMVYTQTQIRHDELSH